MDEKVHKTEENKPLSKNKSGSSKIPLALSNTSTPELNPETQQRIYLKIPKVDDHDFYAIIQFIKKEQGRFDGNKKQWYVTPEKEEKVTSFLHQFPSRKTNPYITGKSSKNTKSNNPGILKLVDSLDRQFVLNLKDGSTLQFSEREICKKAGVKSYDEFENLGEVVNVLEASVAEKVRVIEKANYSILIHNESEDNTCHICYEDKKAGMKISGSQLGGIILKEQSDEELIKLVEDYIQKHLSAKMPNQSDKPVETASETNPYPDKISVNVLEKSLAYLNPPAKEPPQNMELLNTLAGKKVKIYLQVKEYPPTPCDFTAGIKLLKGEIVQRNKDHFMLKGIDGHQYHFSIQEIYSEKQAEVLFRAMKLHLKPSDFSLVAQPELSSTQMEQLYLSFRDGIHTEDILYYSFQSVKAWQMELYRNGLKSGLAFAEIQSVLQKNIGKNSEKLDSQGEIGTLIQERRKQYTEDFKVHDFEPCNNMFYKISQLNQMTHRMNSVKDICRAFKEGTYHNSPAGELIRELGNELRSQELVRINGAIVPER